MKSRLSRFNFLSRCAVLDRPSWFFYSFWMGRIEIWGFRLAGYCFDAVADCLSLCVMVVETIWRLEATEASASFERLAFCFRCDGSESGSPGLRLLATICWSTKLRVRSRLPNVSSSLRIPWMALWSTSSATTILRFFLPFGFGGEGYLPVRVSPPGSRCYLGICLMLSYILSPSSHAWSAQLVGGRG